MTENKFEAHITIEPVFGEKFLEFEHYCKEYGFKPAELLMQKERLATPVRSNKDTFATGHGSDFEFLKANANYLALCLRDAGFKVWRVKIEQILYDVRTPQLVDIQK